MNQLIKCIYISQLSSYERIKTSQQVSMLNMNVAKTLRFIRQYSVKLNEDN
jgi:hypothetical protein